MSDSFVQVTYKSDLEIHLPIKMQNIISEVMYNNCLRKLDFVYFTIVVFGG